MVNLLFERLCIGCSQFLFKTLQNVNVHLLCYVVKLRRALLMLHVAVHPHPDPDPLLLGNLIPIDCQAEKVWGCSRTVKRLGRAAWMQGAQVQIVFYKSPLQGICVYPPAIDLLLGVHWLRRRKRNREVHQTGTGRPKHGLRPSVGPPESWVEESRDKFRLHYCW